MRGDAENVRSRGTTTAATVGLAATVLVAVLAAAASVLAWTHPTHTNLVEQYGQAGHLSYHAAAPANSAYGPSGLTTGEPIYVDVVPTVSMTYSYAFSSSTHAKVSGTEQLVATISNQQGITRHIPLQPATSFSGGTFSTTVTFPAATVAAIGKTFSSAPTVAAGNFPITVAPTVHLHGRLGSALLSATFDPKVNFILQTQAISPNSAAGGTIPATGSAAPKSPGAASPIFNPRATGTLIVAGGKPATSLLGAPIQAIRVIGLVLLALATLASVALGRPLIRRLRTMQEQERIAVRHRSSVVDVSSLPGEGAITLVEIENFDGLLRVARHLECPILHMMRPLGDDYAVVDNGTLYRYRIGSGRPPRVGRVVAPTADSARHARTAN